MRPKRLATKRKKPKKFSWEETEATCVFLTTGHTWYMKQVNCNQLGEWAYHWEWEGFYSVFHRRSCSLIGHFKTEKEAKQLVKILQLKVGTMPKPNSKKGAYNNWLADIKEHSEHCIRKLPDDVKYYDNEDIPF